MFESKFIKNYKTLYCLLSILTLVIGILIYLLFRNKTNFILFQWFPGLRFLDSIYIELNPSVFSYVLKFNIPDMLWFVTGILFLRFIWFNNQKIQNMYIISFYAFGALFEISQISKNVPGTFDIFDLLFMSIGAFVEGLLYNKFTKRRIV